MKKSWILLGLALFCSVTLVYDRATADEKGKTVTVKGTLVDTTCFLKYGYSADEHDNMKACGKDCLKDGTPAGVLVNGKLYILIFPSRVFANYVGKTVEIIGELYADNLLHPKKATVIDKKETKSIKLAGQEMM